MLKPKEARTSNLVIRLSETEHAELKAYAAKRNLTVADLVRIAVSEYVERHGDDPQLETK